MNYQKATLIDYIFIKYQVKKLTIEKGANY